MKIKAVLFDIDGTLVDSNDEHVAAWQTVFRDAGAHFTDQQLHDQIGKGTDMLVPTLLPDADPAQVEKMGKLHGEIFKSRYLEGITPFREARALIEKVAESGRQVVLASSASASERDHYLDLLNIRAFVALSTTSDDVEKTKPAPDIFSVALRRLAPLTANDVLVVGDTPYDVEAAVKCGIGAVAVRSGKFGDDALSGAGALAIYDDVAALLHDFEDSPLNR